MSARCCYDSATPVGGGVRVRWRLWEVDEGIVVARLCRFHEKRLGGAWTKDQYLEHAGLWKLKSPPTVKAFTSYLREHPNVIERWLWYGDRPCPGWLFGRNQDGGYEVAYYPGGDRLLFSEPARACAEFIVREFMLLPNAEPWAV